MVIFVCSCDVNRDIFEPFHHCMEKYWPDHPEVIYATEYLKNPYYRTISHIYSLVEWTRRIRESLSEIDDREILLMIDDLFIRKPVDIQRIEYARTLLNGNVALVNFEKEYDDRNEDIGLNGFKRRKHGAPYELSLMCGLWDRDKLIDILQTDRSPWAVEYAQETKGYDYLINSGDYIIDYGYSYGKHSGLKQGKWCREIVPFFEKEGIKMNYEMRGFYD